MLSVLMWLLFFIIAFTSLFVSGVIVMMIDALIANLMRAYRDYQTKKILRERMKK